MRLRTAARQSGRNRMYIVPVEMTASGACTRRAGSGRQEEVRTAATLSIKRRAARTLVTIHHQELASAASDEQALELFRWRWTVYQNLTDHDYLESSTDLFRILCYRP